MKVANRKATMKKLYTALVLIIGMILSIVLHELFHVIMHWGEIIRIDIFPANGNIAQVVAEPRIGYSVALEEVFAYSITILVIVATFIIAYKVSEK